MHSESLCCDLKIYVFFKEGYENWKLESTRKKKYGVFVSENWLTCQILVNLISGISRGTFFLNLLNSFEFFVFWYFGLKKKRYKFVLPPTRISWWVQCTSIPIFPFRRYYSKYSFGDTFFVFESVGDAEVRFLIWNFTTQHLIWRAKKSRVS